MFGDLLYKNHQKISKTTVEMFVLVRICSFCGSVALAPISMAAEVDVRHPRCEEVRWPQGISRCLATDLEQTIKPVDVAKIIKHEPPRS